MHFARQVSRHIKLDRAGLGFLSLPAIRHPRTFGQANRMAEIGSPEAGDGGITRNRRRNDD
ncbi:hypothetical protein IB265_25085 [Ensifer sp. ENS10]|uniref:hypothetical protein n=1 Tax=Ensifer sp. ENS10 TaxID=2769286 RepID=UPI001785C51E|nr:hypothetical protein [Ensifer sp. ENS10]MBD9510053.1 hypothetical protein [Ensifer sp. ENS10]